MSWLKDRFHGFLDNLTYDLVVRYVIPAAIGSIPSVGYWLLAKYAHIRWDRQISNVLILASIVTMILVGRYLKRKWPSITAEMQRELQ
jgi:hypothetical protein